MKLHILVVVAVMLVMPTASALSHHAFTSFWHMDQSKEITGIVKSIKWVNPHPEMLLEVTEPDGQKSIWNITSRSSAAALRKAWGVEQGTEKLPIGTKVTVLGNPSRKEGAKALVAGLITMPDGKQLSFGGTLGVPQG